MSYRSLLSYTAQDHLPRGDTIHSGLSPPTSIADQENAPYTCLQASLMEVFDQLRFPPLR